MPIFQLELDSNWFPEEELWEEDDGIVALGADLNPQRILAAYARGIFPWNEPETEILWWNPLERMVMRPKDVRITKSSRNLLNQRKFEITFNRAFPEVIKACQKVLRPGQSGTWITQDHVDSFTSLHESGHAHSVEAWQEGKLVGGLYGLTTGSCFAGESMFSSVSNAGKMAFIHLCKRLEHWDIPLIDCQIYNPYLASLGAYRVSRSRFMRELEICKEEHPDWTEIFA